MTELTDQALNELVHVHLEGLCIKCDPNTLKELPRTVSEETQYYECPTCGKTERWKEFKSKLLNSIHDYIKDDKFCHRLMKKGLMEIKWTTFSHLCIVKAHVFSSDGEIEGWVTVRDQSLNRAILLAALKVKGVEV